MKHAYTAELLALALVATPAIAADPTANNDPFLSPMRVREAAPASFFHATLETAQANIGQAIAEPLKRILALHPGTPIVITRGAGVDPATNVLVQVGVIVPDGTPAADGFTVKHLDKFRCAAVLYCGPMRAVGAAYAKAYRELFAAGLQPNGETRQTTLLFAGPDSPDNVVLIHVGLK